MMGRRAQSGEVSMVVHPPSEKVETCWMAGNTQRPESDNKSKIRLLYRGQEIETVGEPQLMQAKEKGEQNRDTKYGKQSSNE